ncbi:MAG: hypothetical protein QM723_06150 [Myxococcaceae bacterium]
MYGFDSETFDACLAVRALVCRADEGALELVQALCCDAPDPYTRGRLAVELLEPFIRLSALPNLNARLQAAAVADERFRSALRCVWGLPIELESWLARLPPEPRPGPLLSDVHPTLAASVKTALAAHGIAVSGDLRVHAEDRARGHLLVHTVPKRLGQWPQTSVIHTALDAAVVAIAVCGQIVVSVELAA